ncbi:pentapeptide repeat-containing protein [Streptosporangium sp. NBC_01756]|uniref:pentapeptide repeat-containing protein n=1 Tax=Streptosporangium sp. NBC_01756 TaxID=2975950 RepID=UPI002DD9FDE4|nr:pentapeptide repeat-containing protein [Streptosporangium sp. NBC_01756]WSC85555.1 pentapeptide repeat-containing protein [Streptosporangium sp. NBC_01756]
MTTFDVGWTTCATSPQCAGSAWRPYGRCLAHLDEAELDEVAGGLSPGSAVDLRGTVVGEHLLERILAATHRRLGRARFDRAVFPGEVRFGGVVFDGDVSFDRARFHRLASFLDARFAGNVSFREVRFSRELSLHGVSVAGHAAFDRVCAGRDALFGSARFERTASFENAEFQGFATFDGTLFSGDATFRGCRFGRASSFRRAEFDGLAGFEAARFWAGCSMAPARVGRRLGLAGAWAGNGFDVTARGCAVDLRRLTVIGPLAVRLDGADADLEGATLRGSATVDGRGSARVTSLRGVDSEALTLSRVDLSTCGFTGVLHPERLRLAGCTFATTPRGVRFELRWPPLRWWTPRRTLADEHAWRGWSGPEIDPPTAHRLAVLYSRLGTGVDDRTTAADFAFGAMEMRRLTSRTAGRWLLSLSWILCGYGLRMGRALGWSVLAAAVMAATLLMSSTSHAARRPAVSPEPPPPVHLSHH